MPLLHSALVAGSLAAVAVWAALSAYVLAIERRRARARATVSMAMAVLTGSGTSRLTLADRVARVRPLLGRASRALVMRAAIDPATPGDAAHTLAAYFVGRWGVDGLLQDAGAHRTSRDKWRRIASLQVLVCLRHPRALDLLARAVDDEDKDVAAVALSRLGESTDPAAAEVLFTALKDRRHPASRVAAQLDRSPQHLAAPLRTLLADADPVLRLWAATLLGRYHDVDGLEADLVRATEDTDARVRKAAIQSLGAVGSGPAAEAALRLLDDPVYYVRANAVRAIGRLDRLDLAADVAAQLGDANWWVRFAARECLGRMGAEVWPVLARLLDHPDRFVRNGAAEVFQNLGLLDSFIMMEAASDSPSNAKIDMLRRIVLAGSVRLTDSLVERTGDAIGERVRDLLARLGLEPVGAA